MFSCVSCLFDQAFSEGCTIMMCTERTKRKQCFCGQACPSGKTSPQSTDQHTPASLCLYVYMRPCAAGERELKNNNNNQKPKNRSQKNNNKIKLRL